MTAGPDISRLSPRAALDAARGVFTPPDAAPAPTVWGAAQQVLQQVIGRPELTGQALIGEVRRQGRITISDAHALVALATWADRSAGHAASESERAIVREAFMALDHAVPDDMVPRPTASSGSGAPVGSPYAPPGSAAWAPPPRPTATVPPAPSTGATSPPPTAGRAAAPEYDVGPDLGTPAASSHRRRLFMGLGGGAVLLLALALGGWWYSGRAERAYRDGVDAYQRGAREVARGAFAQAAQLDDGDARPLVYLGRMTREDGDLPRARRLLTTAVRLAPNSAVAARELASLMLADGQPEIARRFYVRALTLDPTDRTAQGFLGCALSRLQRFDEARRWIERAGPGEWQRCMPLMLPPGAMPGAPFPGAPMPSGPSPYPPS